jgi:hypothetical protein
MISQPWFQAHCYRTYAIGTLMGRGISFDPEMLFVGCMLHDVGLTDHFKQGSDQGLVPGYAGKGAPCFAVRGAGVAQCLAAIHGWPPARSVALAEAISLHLNVRVPKSRGVEAHLLNAASAFDVIRLRFTGSRARRSKVSKADGPATIASASTYLRRGAVNRRPMTTVGERS